MNGTGIARLLRRRVAARRHAVLRAAERLLRRGRVRAREGARVADRAARERGAAARRALAQHILAHLDRYLSACQLGITLASLTLGALGEPAVSALLLAALARRSASRSIPARAWLPVVSIGARVRGDHHAPHDARRAGAEDVGAPARRGHRAAHGARRCVAFTWLFGPFIAAVERDLQRACCAWSGCAPTGAATSPTAEEIRGILSLSARAGHISEREHELTANVFRMIELEVRHIVVPRVDVEFLSLEHPLEEYLERIRTSRHSRLPGLRARPRHDRRASCTRRTCSRRCCAARRPTCARSCARRSSSPTRWRSRTSCSSSSASAQHCAVVLDEHGTAIGLAFREDALEEIVGPLGDEFDEDVQELVEAARRRLRARRAACRSPRSRTGSTSSSRTRRTRARRRSAAT